MNRVQAFKEIVGGDSKEEMEQTCTLKVGWGRGHCMLASSAAHFPRPDHLPLSSAPWVQGWGLPGSAAVKDADARGGLDMQHLDHDNLSLFCATDACAALQPAVRLPLHPSLFTDDGRARNPAEALESSAHMSLFGECPKHEVWRRKRIGEGQLLAGVGLLGGAALRGMHLGEEGKCISAKKGAGCRTGAVVCHILALLPPCRTRQTGHRAAAACALHGMPSLSAAPFQPALPLLRPPAGHRAGGEAGPRELRGMGGEPRAQNAPCGAGLGAACAGTGVGHAALWMCHWLPRPLLGAGGQASAQPQHARPLCRPTSATPPHPHPTRAGDASMAGHGTTYRQQHPEKAERLQEEAKAQAGGAWDEKAARNLLKSLGGAAAHLRGGVEGGDRGGRARPRRGHAMGKPCWAGRLHTPQPPPSS